jgi:hypothetical protein
VADQGVREEVAFFQAVNLILTKRDLTQKPQGSTPSSTGNGKRSRFSASAQCHIQCTCCNSFFAHRLAFSIGPLLTLRTGPDLAFLLLFIASALLRFYSRAFCTATLKPI